MGAAECQELWLDAFDQVGNVMQFRYETHQNLRQGLLEGSILRLRDVVHGFPRAGSNKIKRTRLKYRPAWACGLDAARAPRSSAFLHRRSEEHTSELQSLMRISYAIF